jgi:ABC-type multidrug transport system, ATPase component
MFETKNMQVYYKDFCALNMQGSVRVKKGDRVGIIGANGSGKTTFIKACLGLVPYSGNIISEIKPQEMAVHLQENNYVETMNVVDIMKMVLGKDPYKDTKIREMIDFFSFKESLNKKFKQLSGGQKQRFTVIMVLLQEAPLTFFDEVTTGLDFETRQDLMRKIVEWYENKETALFFVTHYYEELEQMANKIMILDKGRLIDFDDKDKLFEKYCGFSIITLQKTVENEKLLRSYQLLHAPEQTLAVKCSDAKEEYEVMGKLNAQNVNFKRSNDDVEIMSLNAIAGRKELGI